jgi:hypothetical protein
MFLQRPRDDDDDMSDLPMPSMPPPESSPPGSPMRGVQRYSTYENPNQIDDDLAEYFGEGDMPPEDEDAGEDLMDDALIEKYVHYIGVK